MYYNLLNFWLHIKQEGVEISQYLIDAGVGRLIIYGMRELGERLVSEIKNTDIELVCVIDRNENILGDFKLITPDDDIPFADLIVITADYYYEEIKRELEKKTDIKMMSMSMLLTSASHRYIN